MHFAILFNPGQLQNDVLGNTGQLRNIQVDPDAKLSRMPYKCCPLAKFGHLGKNITSITYCNNTTYRRGLYGKLFHAVMGSYPIFLDRFPIRSNSPKVDIYPIRSNISKVDRYPIHIRSISRKYEFLSSPIRYFYTYPPSIRHFSVVLSIRQRWAKLLILVDFDVDIDNILEIDVEIDV